MTTDQEIDFTSSKARKRVESWPVCPRRVRYYQFKSETEARTYGQFTFDARRFGSFVNVWLGTTGHTKSDLRLVEWFLDADQRSDEVLDLPREWRKLEALIQRFIRDQGAPCFCVACNREYAAKELKRMDDTVENSNRAYLYKRLICPEDHLLYESLDLRLIRRPQAIPRL